jgi:hypothetical protein
MLMELWKIQEKIYHSRGYEAKTMLETPCMKHEGLQYFQCRLVKEQATAKTTFLI